MRGASGPSTNRRRERRATESSCAFGRVGRPTQGRRCALPRIDGSPPNDPNSQRLMAMPTCSERLIHFDGRFAPHEKAELHRAVAAVEASLRLAPVPPSVGRPWVIVSVGISSERPYFLAHRMGYPHFLRARTADALCHQICTTWAESVQSSDRPRGASKRSSA